MRLENKVAIITGASNGIGREIALGFAREGANVAVGYAGGKERAEAVAAQIREMGRQATVFQMDIAKPEDAQRVVDETMAAFGRIDILVNNAGSRDPAPVDECTPEVYHHAVDSNLRGLFAAVHHDQRGRRQDHQRQLPVGAAQLQRRTHRLLLHQARHRSHDPRHGG